MENKQLVTNDSDKSSVIDTSVKETSVIRELASKVKERSVFGKLPASVVVNGIELKSMAGAYNYRGPDESLNNKSIKFFGGIKTLSELHASAVANSQHDSICDTHLVFRSPMIEADDFAVVFSYPNNSNELDKRGTFTRSHVIVRMTSEDSERLLEEIKLNPDNAEAFYQMAFGGLDSKDDLMTGLRRKKADSVIVVNADYESVGKYALMQEVSAVTNWIRKFQRLSYSKPMGVVD